MTSVLIMSEESAYIVQRKQLTRLNLLTVLLFLVTVACLVASVYVVIYSGRLSMEAFRGLPQYHLNLLIKNYRNTVAEMDQSMAETQSLVASENAQRVVEAAPQVTDLAQLSEQGFRQLLGDYEESMLFFARRMGGSREWQSHFTSELLQLSERSKAREAAIGDWRAAFPVWTEKAKK